MKLGLFFFFLSVVGLYTVHAAENKSQLYSSTRKALCALFVDAIDNDDISELRSLLVTYPAFSVNGQLSMCDNETLLGYAVNGDKDKAVSLLLLYGASVNAPSGLFNMTPLNVAIANESIRTFNLLLADPAIDVNAVNSGDGKTALHQAVLFGCTWAIQPLLDKGAYINKCDNSGATPLDLARHSLRPHKEAEALLVSYGAIQNSSYQASVREHSTHNIR